MELPFGKYKGHDTADGAVPLDYLIWLEEQDWVKDGLRQDLNDEIEHRRGNRPGAGKVVRPGRP